MSNLQLKYKKKNQLSKTKVECLFLINQKKIRLNKLKKMKSPS